MRFRAWHIPNAPCGACIRRIWTCFHRPSFTNWQVVLDPSNHMAQVMHGHQACRGSFVRMEQDCRQHTWHSVVMFQESLGVDAVTSLDDSQAVPVDPSIAKGAHATLEVKGVQATCLVHNSCWCRTQLKEAFSQSLLFLSESCRVLDDSDRLISPPFCSGVGSQCCKASNLQVAGKRFGDSSGGWYREARMGFQYLLFVLCKQLEEARSICRCEGLGAQSPG